MITSIPNYGIQDIIVAINRFLDEAQRSDVVRQKAIDIVYGSDDEIASVFHWVKENVRYTPDPIDKELFTSPIRMINDFNSGVALGEDCDGMAILSTSLLLVVGVRAKVTLLNMGGEGFDHAISRAYSDKLMRFVNVDPSADVPLGWTYRYFGSLDIGA